MKLRFKGQVQEKNRVQIKSEPVNNRKLKQIFKKLKLIGKPRDYVLTKFEENVNRVNERILMDEDSNRQAEWDVSSRENTENEIELPALPEHDADLDGEEIEENQVQNEPIEAIIQPILVNNEINEPVQNNVAENIRNGAPQIRRKMTEIVNKPECLKTTGNMAENWRQFKRHFDIFMRAAEYTDRADEIKIAKFLNAIGKEAVELYDSLNLTEDQQRSYNAVIEAFDAFCKPKTNEVYERFTFYQRNQKEGEPFDSFLMDIKRLARTCVFGDMEETMLRDRIVMGVANNRLQTKLLETTGLNYTTAVEKCRANEATQEQVSTMNKSATVNEILGNTAQPRNSNANNQRRNENKRYNNNNNTNRTNNSFNRQNRIPGNKNTNNNKQRCSFCSYEHRPNKSECPAFGQTCKSCSKKNHFARVCKFKNVASINADDFDEQSGFYVHALTQFYEGNADEVNSVEQDANEQRIETIDTLAVRSKPIWIENIKIKGKIVSFKVDTGSDVTVLPKRLLILLDPNCELKPSMTRLRAFGGAIITPLGVCNQRCCLRNRTRQIEIEIVEHDTVPLLGLDACIEFGLVDLHAIKNYQKKQNHFL